MTAVATEALTAEQVVETTIAVYGTRPGLAQVRRNGDERGKLTRTGSDGRTEDVSYERRFIRGESILKDKIRLDQKTPTMEYALIAGEGKTWGLINGAVFTPRSDTSADFLAEVHHGIDALLRYKENESTITLVGKDKQKNVDVYMIDLTDKDQRKTRYYISAKYFRILWLEYDEEAPIGGSATKYTRKFFDYRTAQGTLVPFRTVLLETGNWADSGHPTGRKVTFVNSFAIEGHFFNFTTSGQWLWDELEVAIPSGENPYLMVEQIQKIVLAETEKNSQLAEQEWQRAARRYGSHFSALPAIDIRPSGSGVAVMVRYITRAHERYEVRSRLYQAIVELLHRKHVPPPSKSLAAGDGR